MTDSFSAPAAPSARSDWLTPAVSGALAATLGLLTAGIVLAMLGLHHAWLQGPLAVILTIVIFRRLPQRGTMPVVTRPVAIILAGLVVTVTGSNLALRSELVMGGRDGATYANTASFLVEGSGLFPGVVADPFAIDRNLDFDAPGFVVREDGTYWQQFLHATPATYAFFGEIFGKGALFGVNAILSGIGVLVLFAFAMRFMTQWWALLAATITALSLPFAYYGRGTFSEMATLILGIGGLWAAHIALTSQPHVALGAGLVLGGAAMVRVDAWMLAVALSAFLITTVWLGEDTATTTARRIMMGYVATAAVGLVDLVGFAEPYLENVGRQLLLLIVVAIGAAVAAPIAATAPMARLMGLVQRKHRVVAGGITVLMVAFISYLWFVRPLLPPKLSPGVYGLEAIQISEGIPIQPNRAYYEQSVWWLVWYLGFPLVATGFVALVYAVRRSLMAGSAAIRLMALAFIVPTFTYLVRPSVNPDQIWAIRRFLPVVIPGIVVLALALAAAGIARLPDRSLGGRLARGLVALAIIPVAMASGPLFGIADRPGVTGQVETLCASIGEGRSILIIDEDPELRLSWSIGPPLRSWCGATVAAVEAGQARPPGVDLVIATTPQELPPGEATFYELSATAWTSRLAGAPNRTDIRSLSFWVGRP